MACDEAAGIVVGTFFATLALVAVILGVAFFIWRRRQSKGDANKKKVSGSKETYDNPTFSKDVETTVKPLNGDANKAGKDIQTAYTEIRERNSAHTNKDVTDNAVHAGRSKSKARRNLFSDSGHAKSLDFPIHKAGSHGSLDGAVTPNYPEVISVSLQSQDIIGLGFNISGSLSEGIFVSQVHNRGPASESGKIQVGDRILSITISMKNMVYEDALTILSYASPYPVILQLQKAMPIPADDDILDSTKLSHPIYRSQSMDDLSKINRDRWTGPRKTWTQIRRTRPSRDEDREEIEGQLKKWSATHNIVNEDSGLVQNTDDKTSASNLSTDISLDMDEMLGISPGSMLTSTPGSAQVLQVHIPDEIGSKRRSNDDDDFPSKRLRDSVSGENDAEKRHKNKVGRSSSSDSESVSSLSTDSVASIEVTHGVDREKSSEEHIDEKNNDKTVSFSDINENKVDFDEAVVFMQMHEAIDTVHIESVCVDESTTDVQEGSEVSEEEPPTYDTLEIDQAEEEEDPELCEPEGEGEITLTSPSDAEDTAIENTLLEDNTAADENKEAEIFSSSSESSEVEEKEIEEEQDEEEEEEEEEEEQEDQAEITAEETPACETAPPDDITPDEEEETLEDEEIDEPDVATTTEQSLQLDINVDNAPTEDLVHVETPPEGDPHEDEVRAVLKDYFGDDPSLLDQFGFMAGGFSDLSSSSKNMDVSVTTSIEETVTQSQSMDNSSSLEATKMVEGGDGKKSKKYGSKESEPEDETIPKGGIAYYVRIDEGLEPPGGSPPFHYDYNPKGIMNKPQLLFSDGTVATTSDPVEAANLSGRVDKKRSTEKQKQLNGPSPHMDTFYDVDLNTNKMAHDASKTVSNENLNNGAFLMQVKSQDSEA